MATGLRLCSTVLYYFKRITMKAIHKRLDIPTMEQNVHMLDSSKNDALMLSGRLASSRGLESAS
jgi:hypothetical protein